MRVWTHWALAVVSLGVCLAGRAADKEEPKMLPKLPTVPEGKWKGCYFVYNHEKFNATIDAKGVLTIIPLEKGKPVGKPFTCYQLSCYYVPPKEHQKYRPPISFEDPGKPFRFRKSDRPPCTVHIKGMLKDNVRFELRYEFDRNEIEAAGGCEDPKGIEYPTTFRILSHMARSHNIPPSMEQEDREKLLKDCEVKTKERLTARKKTFKYPYWDIMKFSGTLEFAEVKGPYGPRVIRMKPRNQEGTLRGYIYSGYCPWQGYSIYYTTQGEEINLKKNRVIMTIE